ncbi:MULTISPECIES: gp53-like domain-containing protein [Sphingomonas]|uniref:gp53-like domain-containing protein n=1 Tax=Sphingomonas TaxID=13687 RepID=UPI00082EA8A5|nr:hypothetical protein [Sphingomonas sp. CCH10-B3]
MQLIDGPTRAATRPTPLATGTGAASPGWFAQPDLAAGIAPTIPTPDWCNGIQGELMSVITAGSVTPDKASITNLLTALQTLFVPAGGSSGVVTGTDQASIPLAGGFILKVGQTLGTSSEGALTVTFTTAFPNKCWALVPVSVNTSGTNTKDIWPQRQTRTAASVTLFMNLGGGGTTNSIDGVDWIAVGN